MRRLYSITLAILVFTIYAYGQNTKSLSEAHRFYDAKNYEKALPFFLTAIGAGATDPKVNYETGVCYAKSRDLKDQLNAIPFFEIALKDEKNMPVSLYFDLAELYLKNEQIDKALAHFTKYKDLTKLDAKAQVLARKSIEICNNALIFMSAPRNIQVKSFPGTVNTSYTEYNPVVSADESVMAFTTLRPNTGRTRTGDKFIEEILITYNQAGNWSEPVVVPVSSEYNVGTAGISPDGQKMIVFYGGVDDEGSLYQISRSGDTWSKPTLLASTINSKYLESTASITPDGKSIYFASNRSGGKGGMDIWKIDLKADKTWGQPINLGPEVNTKDNEDAPFIHPDQKTLFFTTDGHTTMGGRDIFQTHLVAGKWSRPENMGYPINTTANDNYFTLLADGTRAYFSSDRKGGNGSQDIYFLDMPASASSIPLTMIKGRVINGETGKPMPTKMYVIDNDTKKELDFVYDPDPNTGNYLIILPPNKNYDIVIESEGFLPYTLNVNVPHQTHFYELYQRISLKTIKQFDVVVGQEVQIKNAFYETEQEVKTELRKSHESKLVKSGSVDVYDLMLDLMASNDKAGIDYLVGLIEQTDGVDEINFDETQNSKVESAVRAYYYDESDESKFEKKLVDGKTVFSLPTMVMHEELKKKKENAKPATYDKAALTAFSKIFFDVGQSELKIQYLPELDKILALMNKNTELAVEISGFASAEGDEEKNRELSNKRAISILNYLNYKGIVRRRIVAKGQGIAKETTTNKEEGRRVELRIIDPALKIR
jgi:outer membrane protein OmpA-like peptidoglycan-associated protein